MSWLAKDSFLRCYLEAWLYVAVGWTAFDLVRKVVDSGQSDILQDFRSYWFEGLDEPLFVIPMATLMVLVAAILRGRRRAAIEA